MTDDDTRRLRRQDFWTGVALALGALFMLARTTRIPFLDVRGVGVGPAHWYDSAALAPYAVFGVLLALALGLVVHALRAGGAPRRGDLAAAVAALAGAEGRRVLAAGAIMLAFVFGLVPRVDFTLAGALTLSALIYGFHAMRDRALAVAVVAVLVPALYALVTHYPQAEWGAPHDDDWVTLAAFVALAVAMRVETRAATGRLDPVTRWAPLVGFLAPLTLTLAMAFGFRQNVPNRTGLLFQQIEYQWFVTVKPWLAGGA